MPDYKTLSGLGIYPGSVRGRARVINSSDDIYKLEEGDILVTTVCKKNWLEAYYVISGLVTDTGGIGTHAAMITYELHIPAVLGTKNATREIRDGETIELDGRNGIVRYGLE